MEYLPESAPIGADEVASETGESSMHTAEERA